jgi:hypothetical protein
MNSDKKFDAVVPLEKFGVGILNEKTLNLENETVQRLGQACSEDLFTCLILG